MLLTELLDDLETPRNASSYGAVTAVGGVSDALPTRDQIAAIVACDGYKTTSQWNDWGNLCACVALTDGRFMAWETWTDCTGSGFHHDAYGGDAEIFLGPTADSVIAMLGETSRSALCRSR